MQNELRNQNECQALDPAQLAAIQGGFSAINFPIHTLPLPWPIRILPIGGPVIMPVITPSID